MTVSTLPAVLKYLLSFRKGSWDLVDYPIRVKKIQHDADLEIASAPPGDWRNDLKSWSAQVVNWWSMVGVGDSRQEALLDLAENFTRYIASGERLPRPGTKVPVLFAPSNEILTLEESAVDFFWRVLDKNYYECFVTDQASMLLYWDGECDRDFFDRVKEVYGVDLSDIESANVIEILQRLRLLGAI